MSGVLFDSNVLLDLATGDPVWREWSWKQFQATIAIQLVLINPIIYAELAPAFATHRDLDRWLNSEFFRSP